MDHLEVIHGASILFCDREGPLLDDRTVNDFLGAAWSVEAHWMAIPLERLGAGFLDLKTRIAGEVIQKFINYQMGVAFVGDIAAWTQNSNSLRDFVHESNQGPAVWFVRDTVELAARLSAS